MSTHPTRHRQGTQKMKLTLESMWKLLMLITVSMGVPPSHLNMEGKQMAEENEGMGGTV
jgi:hypothetical protein